MAEKKEKAPKTEKPVVEKAPKIEANGVVRPRSGTATGRIWEIADAKSTELGSPVARKDVLAAAEAEKINAATAATQYGKWRKFHGLGKEVAPAPETAPEAPAAE